MQIDINFINNFQEKIFYESKRNICGSGGFGNGKTTVFCQKLLALAAAFPYYRLAIFRKEFKKLKETTRVTFFKVCPPELYSPAMGGKRSDSLGYLRLINGSEILWLHGDNTDVKILMGLEINLIFVDQAEELDEETYDIMDSRVGRWDNAIIPDHMDKTKFRQNPVTGKFLAPSYMLIACNPEDLDHFIYRKYHPESEEHTLKRIDQVTGQQYAYSDTHIMYQAGSADNPALANENLQALRRKGTAFVRRFYLGNWGIFEGSIHAIDPLSIIDNCPLEFYKEIINKGNLFRVIDHGTSAPTCCLWFSLYQQWLICYREYYNVDARISEHRQRISDLSGEESYSFTLADPSILKAQADKFGETRSIADDYSDAIIDAPPLYLSAGDNNEFRTRNAIDELLAKNKKIPHPITSQLDAPQLYFLKASDKLPTGCTFAISETRRQKREKIGSVEGVDTYSDSRVKGVADHAYDCVRYMAGHRTTYIPRKPKPKNAEGTFLGAVQSMGNRRRRYGNAGEGIRTF